MSGNESKQGASGFQRVKRLFDEASELACSGGEDYELCFAARAGSVQALVEPFQDRFGLRLTQVGTVGQGSGVAISSAPGAPARAPTRPARSWGEAARPKNPL